MKYKKGITPIVLLVLIAVGFGLVFGVGGGLLSIGFDDFLIEDDFKFDDGSWQLTKGANIKDGMLEIISTGGQTESATYNKNLASKDLKIDLRWQTSQLKTATMIVLLNEKQIYGVSKKNTNEDLIIEARLDINDPKLYHVFVNGREINKVRVERDDVFLRIEAKSDNDPRSQSIIKVALLKSRPYFNCQVDADEVVVKDSFKEGRFNINDLTYKPVKFCVDSYPAIKRSLTARGVRADIQGQITKELVTGNDIKVNVGETVEIFYIVDFQRGIGERCNLNQAFDTAINKCINVVSPQPDKIEVIQTKEFISLASNQVLAEGKVKIGSSTLTSNKPTYKCSSTDARATAPSPQPSCWEATVSLGSNQAKYKYGEEKELFNGLKIKYLTSAKYRDGQVQDDYKNTFIITPSKDLFSADFVSSAKEDFFVKFGDKRDLVFTMDNKLADFNSGESGAIVKVTGGLLTTQTSKEVSIPFKKGKNKYSVPIDSGTLGKVDYELTFFYTINGKKIFDDDKLIKNYEVVQTVPADFTTQVSNNSIFSKITDFFKRLLGLN